MNDDLIRFRSLCFLYVCQKLDHDETAWMQQMLDKHPELIRELEVDQHLVNAARDAFADEREHAKSLVDFDQIAEQLETRHSETHHANASTNFVDRVTDWFSSFWNRTLPMGWTATAMASLALVMSVQTYQLYVTSSEQEENSQYRGAGSENKSTITILEVVFADDVSIKDLRRVLPSLDLGIICGPDQQGVTNLILLNASGNGSGNASGSSAAQALADLKASKLVIDARLVQGKPTCEAH